MWNNCRKNKCDMPLFIIYVWCCILLFLGHTHCQSETTLRHDENSIAKALAPLLSRSGTSSQIIDIIRKILTHMKLKDTEPVLPIDQVIEEASDKEVFDSPTFFPRQNAIGFDGDMMMYVQQFAEMQYSGSDNNVFKEAMRIAMRTKASSNRPPDLTDTLSKPNLNALVPSVRQRRAARRDEGRYWQGGIIPIRIPGKGFSKTDLKRMAKGMNQISKATCVCFRIINEAEARSGIPHVRIRNGTGCRSFVGMSVRSRGGYRVQPLILSKRCRQSRVISHELLHVIGLFHEQSRPDRDKYVDIRRENAYTRSLINFNRVGTNTVNSRNIPYDFLSLMHYSSKAFSKNGKFTILPKSRSDRRKFSSRMGRARRLSKHDAKVVNMMYKCKVPRPSRPTCSQYPYKFP